MQNQRDGQSGRFVVACRSIVEGCDFRAHGETSAEATQRLLAHAKNEHDLSVTADIVARARDAVRDEIR